MLKTNPKPTQIGLFPKPKKPTNMLKIEVKNRGLLISAYNGSNLDAVACLVMQCANFHGLVEPMKTHVNKWLMPLVINPNNAPTRPPITGAIQPNATPSYHAIRDYFRRMGCTLID